MKHQAQLLQTCCAALFLSIPGCDTADEPSPGESNCGAKCDALDDTQAAGELGVMGLYEAERASGKTEDAATIDFTKLDLTRKGTLTFRVVFPPHSEDEGEDVPHADLFQVNFDLTPAQYEKIFSLDSPAVKLAEKEFPEGSLRYQQRAVAEPTDDGGRRVFLDWDNAQNENSRKGSVELEIDTKGQIVSAHMIKHAAKSCLLFSCGFKVVFDDELVDITKKRPGLGMRTDGGEIGRATTLDAVQAAVDDPTVENFERLADAE